ncbi:MAG: aminotransferase class IV [Bacteroidales bacterium]|nr:aminotransferase class IV [Bacteroidales bacterium]
MLERSSQILINGKFFPKNNCETNLFNSAFSNGECVWEMFHTNASKILFFESHIERLCTAMKFFGMEIPSKFSRDRLLLKEELTKLLVKNKTFKGGKLFLYVYKKDFEQKSIFNTIDYASMVVQLSSPLYEINKTGLTLSIYNEITKPKNQLSNFQTHVDSIIKKMAINYAQKERVDDTLILNSENHIIESAIHGNIFLVKDKTILTPSLTEGCVNDVMRENVINISKELGYQVEEQTPITQEVIQNIDELFFASTNCGITWASALKNRRFYHSVVQNIFTKVNEIYME